MAASARRLAPGRSSNHPQCCPSLMMPALRRRRRRYCGSYRISARSGKSGPENTYSGPVKKPWQLCAAGQVVRPSKTRYIGPAHYEQTRPKSNDCFAAGRRQRPPACPCHANFLPRRTPGRGCNKGGGEARPSRAAVNARGVPFDHAPPRRTAGVLHVTGRASQPAGKRAGRCRTPLASTLAALPPSLLVAAPPHPTRRGGWAPRRSGRGAQTSGRRGGGPGCRGCPPAASARKQGRDQRSVFLLARRGHPPPPPIRDELLSVLCVKDTARPWHSAPLGPAAPWPPRRP